MKPHTDSPLTLSVLGALHHLRAASIGEVASHIGSNDAPTRDKVGTTLRRLSDAGLVLRGGCAVSDERNASDLWVLTQEGESKRLDLVRRLTGLPNANTNEKEIAPRRNGALSRQANAGLTQRR